MPGPLLLDGVQGVGGRGTVAQAGQAEMTWMLLTVVYAVALALFLRFLWPAADE